MATKVPTKRGLLVGIALIVGLSLGVAVQLFRDRGPGPGPWSVADLIKALQRTETSWDRLRWKLWTYSPGYLQTRCPGLRPAPASEIRRWACQELQRLGPAAAPAVPFLINAIGNRRSRGRSETVPIPIDALGGPRLGVEFEAVRALRAIGPAAATARVPLLRWMSRPTYIAEATMMCATCVDDLPAFARKLRLKTDPLSSFLNEQLSAKTLQALADYSDPGADADLVANAARLGKSPNPVSAFLTYSLSAEMRQALANCQDTGTNAARLREALVPDLFRIIRGPTIYEPRRFAQIPLRPITRFLLGRPAPGVKQIHRHPIVTQKQVKTIQFPRKSRISAPKPFGSI